jgi:hypothetical protein
VTTSAPQLLAQESPLAEIELTISDLAEDIDEALRLVHDGFVEAGYMEPRPSGRRMHLSYLNPGTAFFVARIDGVPVGTCALIADGPFGLPSDRAFAEENDAMRELGAGRLHECGSLAIARSHRRHTRRIMTRVVAAMSRVAIADFPRAPIPLAVAPENSRFYEALVGAELAAASRPLYGAPAILMRTSGRDIARHVTARRTPIERTMDLLIHEPDPTWIEDRRAGSAPPADWLAPLLRECPAFRQLRAQEALIEASCPGLPAPVETVAGRQAA